MTLVFARILLRVIAGIMIGWGLPSDWADQITADPDALSIAGAVVELAFSQAEIIVGLLTWAATETFYWAAKKYGWRT